MADAADLSATDLLAAYAARELSPVEATNAALARIEARNQELNAFCLVDADRALDQARASEDRWQRGEPQGLLDGVPTAIKDLILTAGWPTLRGSRTIDPAGPWNEDAPSVARLREHGAVLLGKTTTPEFGWKGVTDSPLTGVTGNPHDRLCTSGGSSGGSAVAVQTGMAALAIGTDGGGSIRIPAGFTGVVGLKPTYGRVPIYPPSPFGTLSHAGPLTRTVADAALMLDVLSLPDARDWSALPPPQASFVPTAGVAGLRIAFSPALGHAQVDDQVEAVVRRAVAVFEQLGAEVDEVDPGFADPIRAFTVLWFAGAAKTVASLTEEQRQLIDTGLADIAIEGRQISALEYLDATAERMALGEQMGRFHQTYDLLLTPTLPITAFIAGRETPHRDGSRWMSWTPFTYPFNLTQQPAASIPCGVDDDGMPIGLQVVGPRHADARVLQACAAFEPSI